MRLPREWLGPRDELVPIGEGAASEDGPSAAGAVLSAAAFWSEDSAAIQGAVQGSAASRPAPFDSERGSGAPPRIRRRLAIAGIGASGPTSRWVMLGVAIATLVVAAAIGSAEAPSGGAPAGRTEITRASTDRRVGARGTVGSTAAPMNEGAARARSSSQRRSRFYGVTPTGHRGSRVRLHRLARRSRLARWRGGEGGASSRPTRASGRSARTREKHASTSGGPVAAGGQSAGADEPQPTSAQSASTGERQPAAATVGAGSSSSLSAGSGLPAPGGPPPP